MTPTSSGINPAIRLEFTYTSEDLAELQKANAPRVPSRYVVFVVLFLTLAAIMFRELLNRAARLPSAAHVDQHVTGSAPIQGVLSAAPWVLVFGLI